MLCQLVVTHGDSPQRRGNEKRADFVDGKLAFLDGKMNGFAKRR
jgi:hypothetical protein